MARCQLRRRLLGGAQRYADLKHVECASNWCSAQQDAENLALARTADIGPILGGFTHPCRMGPGCAGDMSGGLGTNPEDGCKRPFSTDDVRRVPGKYLDQKVRPSWERQILPRRGSRSEASVGRSAHPILGWRDSHLGYGEYLQSKSVFRLGICLG